MATIGSKVPRILLLYRLTQCLAAPLVFVYLIVRFARRRDYRHHFAERLGYLPRSIPSTAGAGIWFHAVSLGEIASSEPLIRQLRATQPRAAIVVSTATAAGRRAASERLSNLVDAVFYAPLDYTSCVRRVLKRLEPALVVVLETEIWPTMYCEVVRSGAKLALVNARISNRAWPRYRALRWFFRPFVRQADAVFPQSAVDRDRYFDLGVPLHRLHLAGNLKYDAMAAMPPLLVATYGAEQVWIAASTVGKREVRARRGRPAIDEDEAVLDAFAELAREFPKLLLVLAPRQPARFDAVARLLAARKLRFVRRSRLLNEPEPEQVLQLPGVLLIDTIGELSRIFPVADVAFVGGSLAPRGGHNFLEPAAAKVPVIVGQSLENFESIAQELVAIGGLKVIGGPEELAGAVRDLLHDPERRAAMGARGQMLVTHHRGVAEQVAARLWPLYHGATLRPIRSAPARFILAALALIWERGGEQKRQRALRKGRSLAKPVISVGGITIGGSGKTPFVNCLADCLHRDGLMPAILTRGYRRRSSAACMVLLPGDQSPPPSLTGDEAQIFLRRGAAPVGIGADRYRTGEVLLANYPDTDVFLLDDGFQHARLRRDVDLVMIDGLDPFGQEAVVPLGRLREPLRALARADVFVVSRADHDLRYEAICRTLRNLNPSAHTFRARTETQSWRSLYADDEREQLPARRVGAFCGLGNPHAFWATLQTLGLDVVFWWTFEDHHVYRPFELQRMVYQARSRGAELLVTTEKDWINLPAHAGQALAPLELWWLEMRMTLDEEDRFLAHLRTLLKRKPLPRESFFT